MSLKISGKNEQGRTAFPTHWRETLREFCGWGWFVQVTHTGVPRTSPKSPRSPKEDLTQASFLLAGTSPPGSILWMGLRMFHLKNAWGIFPPRHLLEVYNLRLRRDRNLREEQVMWPGQVTELLCALVSLSAQFYCEGVIAGSSTKALNFITSLRLRVWSKGEIVKKENNPKWSQLY